MSKLINILADVNTYIPGAKPAGTPDDLMPVVNTIINIVIGLVGLVAVAMIIYGGLRYTTSAGDSKKVTDAKNTILYGIIGLIVAVLAFAIVNFVIQGLGW